MKKLALAATCLALALPAAANAAADVTINFGATTAIPLNNDFRTNLSALGFTRYATLGSSIILNQATSITFHYMGSESGFTDTFTAGSVLGVENNQAVWSPVLLGTSGFAAGSLATFLNFTSSGGIAATVGQDGFGIFVGDNQVSGSNFTTFYFGYDDEIRNVDDNHDDFIIRATVNAVPEPATWAMLVFGFGIVGSTLRRRSRTHIASFA